MAEEEGSVGAFVSAMFSTNVSARVLCLNSWFISYSSRTKKRITDMVKMMLMSAIEDTIEVIFEVFLKIKKRSL